MKSAMYWTVQVSSKTDETFQPSRSKQESKCGGSYSNTLSIRWNKLAQKIASELDDPIQMWKVYIIIFEVNFPNLQVLDKINTFDYN
jgi:hypothetical protein